MASTRDTVLDLDIDAGLLEDRLQPGGKLLALAFSILHIALDIVDNTLTCRRRRCQIVESKFPNKPTKSESRTLKFQQKR